MRKFRRVRTLSNKEYLELILDIKLFFISALFATECPGQNHLLHHMSII